MAGARRRGSGFLTGVTIETKKAVVSIKQYFDGKKLQPVESSVKRAADALGIGVATVKRIMADYNRDPKLLDEPNRLRGRPTHAVSVTHQEAVRAYIRSANQQGKYITLSDIEGFLRKKRDNRVSGDETIRPEVYLDEFRAQSLFSKAREKPEITMDK